MKVRELIAANKKWKEGVLISVKNGPGNYRCRGRFDIENARNIFGDMDVWAFSGFDLVVTSNYPSAFTYHDLYRNSLEIEPDTIIRIECRGLQGTMMAKEADERFGEYEVKHFYETDIVLV